MADIDTVVIYSTAPPGESSTIAGALVNERLVACVNIVQVRSCYEWRGEVCDEKEDLLIMKARRDQVEAITSRIRSLHSYELPEIIALPIIGGYAPYLEWVAGVRRA
jgi:periplasmic divalent cation tolerance protein